ncbi:MAG: ATP synthase F1 subunit epsilon [Candidatus Woykebacteria bacterium RBG_13_40_7b]|uniref:ATP synthase epsilon chain n=1 Tax=Candidatus Woykebacteria bacterium RBG_13_40_7b TaxID=1802594 RepID=A0A1G1W5Y6_9BACT|nr:MAG: ATP synthase F1 subunit epsilon [Candidatus Woykebacteria bacterium RBG_13_40_7b]
MTTFHLQIVTPEKEVYVDSADELIVPGAEGPLAIVPGHTPLLTSLNPGELTIKKGKETIHLAIGSGFIEITQKTVKVLTDLASKPEEISEKEVEEARRRAQEALKEKHRLSDEEYASAAATLQKALAQLKVKRRHVPKGVKTAETAL